MLAERHSGTAAGVTAARAGAEHAFAIYRGGGGDSYLGSALRLLDQAARDPALPGACDAAARAVELAAVVGRHAEAADRAQHLIGRFEDVTAAADCVAGMRRRAGGLPDPSPAPTAVAAPAPGDAWVQSTQKQQRPVRLERAEVYGRADADGVRAVLYFDGVAVYRRGELSAEGELPRRVVLDLDEAALGSRVPGMLSVRRGGLQRMRAVPLSRGRVRVAFDLEADATYRAFFLPRPFRVVIDFHSGRARVETGRGRRIVLDAGHGGRNPGAKGPTGLRESDVALSLARRVRHALRRKLPGAQVIMTRDEDVEVSLEERAAIANGSGADVFVSIHLNASGSPEDRGGVSTFVLDTTDDRQALRLAARENGGSEQDVTDLQVILAALHRKEQVAHSTGLAHAIHDRALARGRALLPTLEDRGVKQAMFYVLVGATMPAVLVEASFITRPEEEQALRTDAYRAALSDGIADGIVAFLAPGAGQ